MSTLIIADHDLGVLSPATARVIHAVAELGPIEVLVLGQDTTAVAAEAAKLAGVTKVIVAHSAGTADGDVQVIETLAPRYTYLVQSAGSVGKDRMPRLAARLDLMPVTDIVGILGPTRFTRPIYAGNALQTVTDNQPQHILTIRASAFRAAAGGNDSPIEAIDVPVISAAKLIAQHRTESNTPDLATAQIVVGGGVALGYSENFKLIEQLAKKLGAAIGATRAAVDAGYAPNDWQVGQTGKIIAPDLYIAIGISGALQHLAGIQGAKKIVAINSDPEAPLVKLADVALIGDLFEIIPQLIAELEKAGVNR
ncbi:electron transfer flavoprotein subunit alpha/FixB family protein [Devosia psychrophila]|uniref:Electron transfer flavoprotein subunit alpha n=1 Tax=Devosia psychrophila TaxID=728005 RepID=A0A0F5PX90_9HYPH|nr:FAD-binding protein [Devosia psychrophila]KKC33220.1 electron transfer flavoprotein subunit beta [Devosia psychrophila]SFC26797.1 electron transfer flavoprotein alpha subunit [Devosia psychrophila]